MVGGEGGSSCSSDNNNNNHEHKENNNDNKKKNLNSNKGACLEDVKKGLMKGGAVAGVYTLLMTLLKRRLPKKDVLLAAGGAGAFVFVYRLVYKLLKGLERKLEVEVGGKREGEGEEEGEEGGGRKGRNTFLREGKTEWKLSDWSSSLASVAGVSGAVSVDPSFASSLFVSWCFIKAFGPPFCRYLLSSLFPPPPPKKRGGEEEGERERAWWEKYIGVIVMAMATTIALPAGYKRPSLHHPAYRAFLHTWVYAAKTTVPKFMYPTPNGTLSDSIHPGLTIPEFILKRAIPSTFRLSFALYFPLHTTWGLIRLFSTYLAKKKKKGGEEGGEGEGKRGLLWKFLRNTGENVVRSVLFLACYVMGLWVSVLLHSQLLPLGKPLPQYQIYSYAWISALFVLFEREGRQLDLGLYVSSHALNCVWNGLVERGSVVPSTRGGAGMLAVSAAYAFHQLQKKNISWPFSSLFVEGL